MRWRRNDIAGRASVEKGKTGGARPSTDTHNKSSRTTETSYKTGERTWTKSSTADGLSEKELHGQRKRLPNSMVFNSTARDEYPVNSETFPQVPAKWRENSMMNGELGNGRSFGDSAKLWTGVSPESVRDKGAEFAYVEINLRRDDPVLYLRILRTFLIYF